MKVASMLGIVLGVASVFWASPAWPAPKAYVPTLGDTLCYALSNGDIATTRVVRVRADGSRLLATLERTVEHGAKHESEHMTLVRTDQGIALRLPEVEGLPTETTPLVCYLTQAGINDTWTAQKGSYRDADGAEAEYRVYAHLDAIETVRVKAGTFTGCYRVSYRTAMASGETPTNTTMQIWFKPELGIVKTRTVENGTATETELVSYTTSSYGRGQRP